MNSPELPEVWLRGALPSIPNLLQPAAHALLQAKEEINNLMKDFDESLLWEKPAGLASAAFHLQHIAGVQDRLFTYAKAKMLTEEQLAYLKNEGIKDEKVTRESLLKNLNDQTKKSIDQLAATVPDTLTEARSVGRKQLPSTVLGLLFHAAEHTMRHTGQLLTTVKILTSLQHSSAGTEGYKSNPDLIQS